MQGKTPSVQLQKLVDSMLSRFWRLSKLTVDLQNIKLKNYFYIL